MRRIAELGSSAEPQSRSHYMKNQIFSDPMDWAAKLIGTCFRYRVMQFLTLLLGGGLAFMIFVVSREASLPLIGYFSILVVLLVVAIELPLLYLRALRFYVLHSQSKNEEKR